MREKDDTEICKEMFKEELGLDEMTVETVYRLGQPQDGKIRPAIVRFEEERTKWDVIKRGRDMRQAKDQKYREIKIWVDMTRQEREESKALREELRQKREEGGQWIIKHKRVVEVNEDRRRARY